MISTFHGLETARRGMMTQQSALHTTGHNIANANTEGYTRQRVNFNQTEPYPSIGMNSPKIPGHIGTGVEAGSIQRVREEFLDVQYRNESNKSGYWTARYEALTKMEDIMNEPSEEALANTIDQFWSSLQDLAVHPEDPGARSVVRQRGNAVAETFRYAHDSLSSIRGDYKGQIDTNALEMNSIIRQIDTINKQIGEIEPHGYVPNDLYDERDRLLDQLSDYVNFKTEKVASGGKPSPAAEGKVSVKLIDNAGNELDPPGAIIDGSGEGNPQGIAINYTDDGGYVDSISFGELNDSNQVEGGGEGLSGDEFPQGKIKAAVQAYGFVSNGNQNEGDDEEQGEDGPIIKGDYPEMLANLDEMAYVFATEFNKIHQTGWSLNEINDGSKANNGEGIPFFEVKEDENEGDDPRSGFAGKIKLSDAINESVNNIAAAGAGENIYTGIPLVEGANDNVGNPILRGVFTGVPDDVANGRDIDEIKIDVEYDGDKWGYVVRDEFGATLHNEEEFAPPTASIYGLTIDITELNLTDEEGSYSWSIDGLTVGTREGAFSGDGSNAQALSNIKDERFNFAGSTGNVQSFYRGVIGDMAVDTSEAKRMQDNSNTLRDSVQFNRDSVSNVSLDEEMTNMIQFQHGYNASARMITLVDEMLDRIINGMGVAGR
ncbi:flagellar hook-associated protein FlgK [Desertibacillus haloalkaliphilus]|uniref:flagellar hook-associated protein FlgK n=1 Tax=Desertibacillus haloalkaliphilus TaxID=1328930 RepID=UPI001C25DFF9|nr:flagellar hook-associated protein FlgK [Desertibacillus haloalkaliphilus]MBU8905987.1 flagellar hook-associated protein FlgK [Desertibacillus haloalkaliphilus]